MKAIYQLIRSLTSSQWQTLEKYLTCFSSNNEAQKKSLRLAQLLRESEYAQSAKFYSKKLYGKENVASLERLARHLRNKTLDSLTSGLHGKDENETDRNSIMLKLKKKSLQFNYLFINMPDLKVTENLLDEIIMNAKQYELYSMLLEHLKRKKWEYSLREGELAFDKVSEEIQYNKKCEEAVDMAYEYICKLKILHEYSGKHNENKIRFLLKKAIPHLQYLHAETQSSLVLYYLKTLKMEYHTQKKNYLRARSIVLEQLKLVKSSKAIFKKERVGILFNELSVCEMHLGRFDQALDHAQHSLQFFKAESFNYALSKQNEFYALFLGRQYKEAEACVKEMTSGLSARELGDFRWEKFYFLLANALFMVKRYNEVNEFLKYKFTIKQDKEGWEFNWRVLQIMTNVELGYCDEASVQAERLRNFIASNEENTPFTPRHKTINKFLSHSAHKSFMFSQLNGKTHNFLKLLSSPDNEYSWEILSSELIPFHNWAASKMKERVLGSVLDI